MELLEENFLGSDTEQVCYEAGLSLDIVRASKLRNETDLSEQG
jgi:hypothetical protein